MLKRIEIVNVRVQYVESVRVPERSEELSLAFHDRLAVETARKPRCGVHDKVPADRIRPVLGKGFHRIHRIALGLAHLLSVLVLDKAEHDDILKARLVENERRDRVQRVEPSSRLIDRLGNEGSRELGFEKFLILERIMMLCKRHGTRVEPAVNDFRYAVHNAAAARALELDTVDERLVQFDIVRAVRGHFLQFLLGSDRMLLAAVIADPYRKRCSPVTVAGERPVLNILQPVAETSLTDALRDPVDLLVVRDKVILDGCHADEPGLARIVNERCSASPAVRIIMLELRSCSEKPALLKILEDLGVCAHRAFFHFLLGRLAAVAGERRIRCHSALLIDEFEERKVIVASDPGVILTECRSDMNDAGTVCHGDVLVDRHEMSLLALLFSSCSRAFVERLIFHAFEVGSDVALKDLLALTEDFLDQRFRHNIGILSVNDLHIRLMRVHAERGVGRKCPRGRRPCKEIEISVLCLEADDRRLFLQCFVALCHLVARERCSAGRAVRDNFISLVKKVFVKNLLQCPPLGLDKIIVICHVGVVHIRPESYDVGEFSPHAFVLPHGFLALFDERLNAVFLDCLLALDPDDLLDLNLDRKAVRIPSGFTRNILTLHGMVTRDHVLDDARQNVSDVRLAVRCRRSVKEHVRGISLSLFDALLKDIVVLPEFGGLFFPLNKIHVCFYFFIHTPLAPFLVRSALYKLSLYGVPAPLVKKNPRAAAGVLTSLYIGKSGEKEPRQPPGILPCHRRIAGQGQFHIIISQAGQDSHPARPDFGR